MASRQPRGFVPALIFVALMGSVVSSLGVPLIPQIAEDMDIGLESAQWVLIVTLLCGAVATPLLGRLGDGPHRKRVMLGTIAFLTVGAGIGAVGAEVSSLAVLLAGRGMMGGGFALLPLTMAAARETLPRADTARVIGILSVTVVTGVGVGYPLTGSSRMSAGCRRLSGSERPSGS